MKTTTGGKRGLKGRGTASNPSGRFEVRKTARLDPAEEHGATLWDNMDDDEPPARPPS